jgi:assimilatory nitrate reductase catalytic subunit
MRQSIELPKGSWWARVPLNGGIGTLVASTEGPKVWREHARTLLKTSELAEFIDNTSGTYRAASFCDGRLDGALFIGSAQTAPLWDAVKTMFELDAIGDAQRRILLSGRAASGLADTGPTICACFGVGLATIRDAIASKAATDVQTIGKALRAGTNCGSCLPELKRIVHEHALAS